jgi:hypothetical protein
VLHSFRSEIKRRCSVCMKQFWSSVEWGREVTRWEYVRSALLKARATGRHTKTRLLLVVHDYDDPPNVSASCSK